VANSLIPATVSVSVTYNDRYRALGFTFRAVEIRFLFLTTRCPAVGTAQFHMKCITENAL
jgi:hypothetical protein